MTIKQKWGAGVFGLAVVVGLVWIIVKPSKTEDPDTIRIGYLPIAASLPLYVAVEKGYLVDEGLKFELLALGSSNELGTAAAAGKVDVMTSLACNVAFDIGGASEHRFQMFGANIYSDRPGHIVDYFAVRPGSGITRLEEVKGKRVAAFPGSVTRIFVFETLKKHGVSEKDITYLEMAPKDWQAAFSSGTIDAASVMDPQATQMFADKAAEPILHGFFARFMPDVPLSAHWFSDAFASKEKQTKAVVRAYDRAVDFIRSHPDESRAYYEKYTGIKPEIAAKVPLMLWKKSSELDPTQIQSFADLLAEHRAIKSVDDVSKYLYRR